MITLYVFMGMLLNITTTVVPLGTNAVGEGVVSEQRLGSLLEPKNNILIFE